MAKANEPTVIKKYANRRLYNTGTSTYVTLEDLAAMIKAGVKPLGTVVAGDQKHALVSAFLAKHFTGVVGSDLRQPIGTVTTVDAAIRAPQSMDAYPMKS